MPWLGCWQLLEENVREDNPADPTDIEASRQSSPRQGVLVCVAPSDQPSGVKLRTLVEKQTSLEETVVADGTRRPITEPGCEGWQRAEWSRNGQRLFARAELVCGDQTPRTVSGLSTMAPGAIWVDIQVVQMGGRESIRIRRYQRAPDQTRTGGDVSLDAFARAASTAARLGATSFTIEEVKEANTKVVPSALEGALIETNARFPLNSKRLIELDDAGVPDRVIDLMVALSFPKRFVVERPSPARSGYSGGFARFPMGLGSSTWDFDSYYLWPYYYAPFGYSYWGRYNADYYTPGYVVTTGEAGGAIQPSGQGRVVDGLGYTRVRPRETGTAHFYGGGEGSPSSGGSGSSSGSSGGVSSQGYSSGGSGGDSGRTAQPRPPQ
jgi:uncharacterized membrane protein YgcG